MPVFFFMKFFLQILASFSTIMSIGLFFVQDAVAADPPLEAGIVCIASGGGTSTDCTLTNLDDDVAGAYLSVYFCPTGDDPNCGEGDFSVGEFVAGSVDCVVPEDTFESPDMTQGYGTWKAYV